MGYLLGIDVGTSGVKTCLFHLDGLLAAAASADYPLMQPKPGWAEQHPDDWWQAVKTTIQEIMGRTGIQATEIAGIGLSGQMHGLVLLDQAGKVLRPAIIWCDQRTQPEAEWMRKKLGQEEIIRLTANPPLPNFTATKLLWVRKHEPHLYEKVAKVLLPKDYIRYKLTGEFATEVSDASGTLLLDVAARRWSREMAQSLEIRLEWLPRVYESYEISGRISGIAAQETGLAAGIPVAGGGGDQAAGAVGNGIVKSGIVSGSLGTSGVVFAYTDEIVTDAQGRLHSFCHAVPGKWHVMGVTQAAGGSLQWFRNQFGALETSVAPFLQKDPYEFFSEEANLAPAGSEGLLFLPYLMGERTPHLDPAAKGAFVGITARHQRQHFIRAVMEGVAYSLLDSMGLMRELGIEISHLRASGGGARSRVWRQIMADIFNCEVRTVEANEGPAFGAALLAGVGTGVFNSVEEACAAAIRTADQLHPVPAHVSVYQYYYPVYRKLYGDLKESFGLLHALVGKGE
ncbi:xylulokinase [Brevibacillus sp. B_LB10_24]|uniref:xylulokinase n=1 Tax=Brevibacillus sp. B_LB10_24 TaxID=3380645 RepID=UPI0038BB352B